MVGLAVYREIQGKSRISIWLSNGIVAEIDGYIWYNTNGVLFSDWQFNHALSYFLSALQWHTLIWDQYVLQME